MVWFPCSILAKKGARLESCNSLPIVFWKTRIHESSWSEIHLRIRLFNPWTGFSSNWASIISPNNVSVAFTKKNPKELKKKKHTTSSHWITDHPKKKGFQEKRVRGFPLSHRTTNPGTLEPSCQVTGLTCKRAFLGAKKKMVSYHQGHLNN